MIAMSASNRIGEPTGIPGASAVARMIDTISSSPSFASDNPTSSRGLEPGSFGRLMFLQDAWNASGRGLGRSCLSQDITLDPVAATACRRASML